MFGFAKVFGGRVPRRTPLKARLGVEALESRHCLSPVITSLTSMILPGHVVQLSGTVTDDPSPAGVNVAFSGAATGQTTTDSAGNFLMQTQSASLGTVSAVGTDTQGQTSSAASSLITDTAPNLTLSITCGPRRMVTLSGTLTDVDQGGLMVTFSGMVPAGSTTTTNSDGSFSLTVQATGLGSIQATTTDLWGLASNAAQVAVTDNPPIIFNFQAIQGPYNLWTFSGQVADQSPAGLVVNLWGVGTITATATVQADGTFSVTLVIPPYFWGTMCAETTDWYGLSSNIATTFVS